MRSLFATLSFSNPRKTGSMAVSFFWVFFGNRTCHSSAPSGERLPNLSLARLLPSRFYQLKIIVFLKKRDSIQLSRKLKAQICELKGTKVRALELTFELV